SRSYCLARAGVSAAEAQTNCRDSRAGRASPAAGIAGAFGLVRTTNAGTRRVLASFSAVGTSFRNATGGGGGGAARAGGSRARAVKATARVADGRDGTASLP